MNHQTPLSRPGSLVYPTENDIILGRGVLHATNPGNIRFYEIVDAYLPLYEAAQSRPEKTKLIQRIYEEITEQSRFVKDHAASAACIVIEKAIAKKKISHAIRFRQQGRKSLPPAVSQKVKPGSIGVPSKPPPRKNCKRAVKGVKTRQIAQAEQVVARTPIAVQECRPIHEPRKRSKSVESDCIFASGELESVLLPPEDLASASLVYEDLLLKESLEEQQYNRHSVPPNTSRLVQDALDATSAFKNEPKGSNIAPRQISLFSLSKGIQHSNTTL